MVSARHRALEIHPAHDAGDEGIVARELEHEARFRDRGRRLHEHGGADAGARELRREIVPAG